MSSSSIDISDWLDGPPLVALWSSNDPNQQFELGSREYGWHSHLRGQMFCVENGLIQVHTEHGSWILPPHRAGWIPPCIRHKVSVSGVLSGWSVLLVPEICKELPEQPRVFGISSLMSSLVERASTWSLQDQLNEVQDRVVGVLLDEIKQAPQQLLYLPLPTDSGLLKIAREIISHPEDTRTLDQWAKWGALSPRTLRRMILQETGLTFAQWRQQARLTHALEMLARGESISDIADALGYATPSGFIEMFHRAFGDSPARYFSINSNQNKKHN
ncbi:helix-turn-helix transcriptional regulator [Clostridium sp. OS1-26]|uniref:AraC family transcriptional regulator n=1 Tax=Clostridium sp. OS1-26 TaxID=3070681 RepID=UPI0027E149F9|nr:helix-turn-helix transcriptional regulator [Clostridium sp. OS1-26]WML37686.1 helix-turn-helix transcriptional regulator [Clostridium sp. OS1-26]